MCTALAYISIAGSSETVRESRQFVLQRCPGSVAQARGVFDINYRAAVNARRKFARGTFVSARSSYRNLTRSRERYLPVAPFAPDMNIKIF